MVRLNKIYTRTGDAGTAGLVDGSRVSKSGLRMTAIFDLGADVATPGDVEGALRIVASQVDRLEREIDDMNADLAPLTSFILPSGSAAVASLHLARTVVRRAERAAVALNEAEALNPHLLAYLNRLSDHLFVGARKVAASEGGDVLWQPGATRD